MHTITPQYIKDTAGRKMVILPEKDFDRLIDELEELEDIRLYDKAKKADNGERISFSDYLKNRKKENAGL
jgi:PHD/YefM family antitoxin component YafN of YafNO toxin-antitoxin module